VAPNVTVSFWAANDINGTPLLTITDEDTFFRGLILRPDLYSLGGWELILSRAWGFQLFDSGAVDAEVFVRFMVHAYSDTTWYYGGVLNKRDLTVVHRQEIGEEVLHLGGSGPKAYMDRSALGIQQRSGLGFNLDLPNGVWRWNEAATAGRILQAVVNEDAARANPSLPDLTDNFNFTVDSDGTPWTNEVTPGPGEYSTPIGSSLLDVIFDLEDLTELITTVHLGSLATPEYELNAFQVFGDDHTGSVFGPNVGLLREGVNIANEALVVEGVAFRKATHVIVEGKDDVWVVEIKPSWSPGDYVKWDKISYPRSSNEDTLHRAGLRWLRRQENAEQQITVEIVPGNDPDNGYYFPAPNDPIWLGDTITLDTVADGSVHSPLDYNNADVLVTGLDLQLGEAGDNSTADREAKSWNVKVRLNWERAGNPGAPDQTSASSGCQCPPNGPPAPNPGEPGTVTTVTNSGGAGDNGENQGVVVSAGQGQLIAVLQTYFLSSTPTPAYWSTSGGATIQSMDIIGTVTHPLGPFTGGHGNKLFIARLENPVASGAGASVKWGPPGGLAGLKGYWTTPSTVVPTIVTATGVGQTAAITPTGATSVDLVLMTAGNRISSLGDAGNTPVDLSGQTDDWAVDMNNGSGQADGTWYGGHLAGAGIREVDMIVSRNWITAAIILAGVGGIEGDETEPIGGTGDGSTGDSPIYSPIDHVHEHVLLSDDDLHYHDVSQIEGLPSSPNVEDLPTAETDTSLVLVPDGTGGLDFVTIAAAGGITAEDLPTIGHYEVVVSGTAPPVATTNMAEDDWIYGWVSG
jgi:hypothetical protein